MIAEWRGTSSPGASISQSCTLKPWRRLRPMHFQPFLWQIGDRRGHQGSWTSCNRSSGGRYPPGVSDRSRSGIAWGESRHHCEFFKGLDDAFGHERLHTIEPNVLGGTVYEKDSVEVTHLADGVAKNYVQVELVEVVDVGSEGFSAGPLAEVGKLADRRAGFNPPGQTWQP